MYRLSKWNLTLVLGCALALALALGCSDDTEPTADASVDQGGATDAAPDKKVPPKTDARPDQAPPDKGADGSTTKCIAKCGYGFSCQGTKCVKDKPKKDHSKLITKYEGPKTCIGCHSSAMDQIMGSTHYKFSASLQADYIFDKAGKPVAQKYTGKNWKLCGFPTAFPMFNWMGKLKDDAKTPHIDKPGGCGKCHIGVGLKPYSMAAKTAPSAAEKANNVDCLVCHAKGYARKFYVATKGGKPELNALGSPMVFTAPRADGVFDFSGQLTAAKAVGRTTADNCNGCHAKAGGGAEKIGNTTYSFKRASGFSAESDVHAKAGLDCAACHYAGKHRFKRARNADLTAYDTVSKTRGCVDCHGAAPHKNATYNKHTAKIACETCHATSKGGVTYKDFSQVVCPSGDCSASTLNLYGVKLTKYPNDFKLTYAWFNGKVEQPIHPKGDKTDGKIYPFKEGLFKQPKDAAGKPIPVKWGKVFVAGDMNAALTAGTKLYSDWLGAFSGKPADYGLPAVPGKLDKYTETKDLFSISHGITRTGALTCKGCHAKTGAVLDWTKLGLTNPSPM